MKFSAIILAGQSKDPDLVVKDSERYAALGKTYVGHKNKALFRLGNKYLLQRLVDSFNKSKYVNKVFVVGPKQVYGKKIKNCKFVDSDGTLKENLNEAIRKVKQRRKIICSSDLWDLNTEDINLFFEENRNYWDCTGIFPLIDVNVAKKKYPGLCTNVVYKLKNDQGKTVKCLTTNLMILNITEEINADLNVGYVLRGQGIPRKALNIIKRVITMHPWVMLKALYILTPLMVRYVLFGVDLSYLERKAEQVVKHLPIVKKGLKNPKARMYITKIASLAADIDTEQDLDYARNYLKKGK
jgi:GTP:adenosylcobinamide-phosphate guanylyltransferase